MGGADDSNEFKNFLMVDNMLRQTGTGSERVSTNYVDRFLLIALLLLFCYVLVLQLLLYGWYREIPPFNNPVFVSQESSSREVSQSTKSVILLV
uniref:Uncharacterized protein n=1 Tax=Ditylenchus dipsaci TaxID=166011 RepID=A0A915EGU6_9BILA